MERFRKILFTLDLSDVAPRMVPFVMSMAKMYGSEVHLLFVMHFFEHFTGIYAPDISTTSLEEEMVRGAERKMEKFVQERFPDGRVKSAKVVVGDTTEEILKYINHEKIDLVIMGTHGRKGLDQLFFGSIAEKIVKTSPVPVLTINPWRKRQDLS